MVKQAEEVAHSELTGGGPTILHSHAGGGGGLVDKSGMVTPDGSAEAVVTFNTPYGSLDYFIQLTAGESTDAIICNVKSGTKTVSGFTIIAINVLVIYLGEAEPNVDVYWCTGPFSNP